MSDSVVNGAFKDTASAAIEMLGKMEADNSNPVVETPVVANQTPETPVVATPSVEPTVQIANPESPESSVLDVSPDTRVRIKVNGEEKIVSAKDYTEMLQRTDVFTQRQQALAAQRQQLEQHYTQREAQLQQQALWVQQQAQLAQQQGDPVARLVEQLQKSQTQQAPAVNPNEIATIGEVQQAMLALRQQQQEELQRLQQATQQEILSAREQARQEQMLAQDQKRITDTVRSILDSEDGKLLKEINPQAEAIIRYNALQMGPRDVDQAVEFLHQYTQGWAEKVKGKFAHQTTAQAVQTAKTVMEPPSGTTPMITNQVKAPALKKDGTVDWNILRERALSMLE